MSKTKIDFLEQIELTVKDTAGEFVKTAVTSGEGIYTGEDTSFTVNSTSGFTAGNSVYIHDGTPNSGFTTVKAIDGDAVIIIAGDFSAILSGAVIKKKRCGNLFNASNSILLKVQTAGKNRKENDIFTIKNF